MRILPLILLLLTLVGCASRTDHVVIQKFPEIPEELLIPCPRLLLANESSEKLSDFLQIVLMNYERYEQCSTKVDAFIDWYYKQKHIQREVKGD